VCRPRYHAHPEVSPLFPFGHGLGYAAFNYSNLRLYSGRVEVDVSNAGAVSGSEVVQLYLTFPSSAGEPPRQLKGFVKVGPLRPGKGATVPFALGARSLSVWDSGDGAHAWAEVKGTFTVEVGASSADIRLAAAYVNE